jgi:hypothetical protein
MQPIYSRPAAPLGAATANYETVITGKVFTNLLFELGLKNVTVELGFSEENNLVKMEFVESKLRFEGGIPFLSIIFFVDFIFPIFATCTKIK